MYIFIYLSALHLSCSMWDLIPWPGIKPGPSALGAWSLSYLEHQGKVKMRVAQLCPTLCNPMDYIVHGILQVRILEWVAFPFSRGSSQPRNLPNPGIKPRSPTLQVDLYQMSHQGSYNFDRWHLLAFAPSSVPKTMSLCGGRKKLSKLQCHSL